MLMNKSVETLKAIGVFYVATLEGEKPPKKRPVA